MNGFGRFGLHLLKYWLARNSESNFSIKYINDDFLDINQAYDIITSDEYVKFNKYKIQIVDSNLSILEPNGRKHEIYYTNNKQNEISWLGKPKIFFECTGKYTISDKCDIYLKDQTETVLISATSWDVDKTLVYGYNHREYDSSLKKISYGSCTVNAFVPFASWIDNNFRLSNSDVNVIHNIQEYRVKDNYTLLRKFCTLEKSAKHLMKSINDDNFIVNYTVIPYTGVSMIDFRFEVKEEVTLEKFISKLDNSIKNGRLKGLYGIDESDIGPEVYNCTTFSSVFIKEGIKKLGNSIYLQAYFDNENSVNRYFDLANYILSN